MLKHKRNDSNVGSVIAIIRCLKPEAATVSMVQLALLNMATNILAEISIPVVGTVFLVKALGGDGQLPMQ